MQCECIVKLKSYGVCCHADWSHSSRHLSSDMAITKTS